MAVLAAIIMAATLLENDDFFALGLSDDLGRDRHLRSIGNRAVLACEQDVAQRDLVTGFTQQLLNRDFVSGGNPILLTARAHYSEHDTLTCQIKMRRICTSATPQSPATRQGPKERCP